MKHLAALTRSRVSPADGELSDEDEEVDSNNDGGSLQSERTDKDEEAYDSESPASADTSTEFQMLEIASWWKKKSTNLWCCFSATVTLSGTMRGVEGGIPAVTRQHTLGAI